MGPNSQKNCPRCQSAAVKSWDELTGEQKMLAEKLPASAEFSPEERKKHRFCIRCWYEDASTRPANA